MPAKDGSQLAADFGTARGRTRGDAGGDLQRVDAFDLRHGMSVAAQVFVERDQVPVDGMDPLVLGLDVARLVTAEDEVRNPNVILETELVVRESCGASLARLTC